LVAKDCLIIFTQYFASLIHWLPIYLQDHNPGPSCRTLLEKRERLLHKIFSYIWADDGLLFTAHTVLLMALAL
jgi:hypothetical protein